MMDDRVKLSHASFLSLMVVASSVSFLLGWSAYEATGEGPHLVEARAQRDDAERRMGACIDIAADAREFALLSEEAWLNAADDAAHCQMSEGWMYNICPGSEYWTSYGWGGPG